MEQLIQNTNNERMLYDPQVYCILGRWLALINQSCDESGEQIVNRAAEEHPELREFLDRAGFVGIWEKLQRNDPQRKNLIRQFHAWFDGLKTLKLIHHLTEKGHSKLPVYQAVKGLQMLIGSPETERCTLTDRSTMVAVRSLLLKMEMTAKRHAGIEISP